MKSGDLSEDPFQEGSPLLRPRRLQILGARLTFDSNSEALLRIVDAAYAGLPAHRLTNNPLELTVSLRLLPSQRSRARPPAFTMLNGAAFLGAASADSNCVLISPQQRSALVLVAHSMLRYPYHIRYEFIEFAAFTLAARSQALLAMHGACVGRHGQGLLIVGDSGAGKSTIALHSLLAGLEVLSEDSVFIQANSLLAVGVANFLHLRAESLRLVDSSKDRDLIRRSPVIRRRSGVEKYEIDLRQARFNLAKRPLALRGVVFLSAKRARGANLVHSLSKATALKLLAKMQPYARQQPGWREFSRQISRLDCLELRRGGHPREAVAALSEYLPIRP
jgi:hypothetical protein